jgi:hypothetical protein
LRSGRSTLLFVRLVAVLLVTLLAGCGASHHRRLSVSPDGKAVIRDAFDGHLDRSWSCGSLRAALDRLPSTPDQTIPLMIDSAAGRACDDALLGVHRGQTRAQATALLGPPDRTPRCWLYSWPPDESSAVDGARLCFTGDWVSLVQTSVHG